MTLTKTEVIDILEEIDGKKYVAEYSVRSDKFSKMSCKILRKYYNRIDVVINHYEYKKTSEYRYTVNLDESWVDTYEIAYHAVSMSSTKKFLDFIELHEMYKINKQLNKGV